MMQRGQGAKAELGAFLRMRRERLTPEQVGLPPSPRRRTMGLRREEVAILAGVSVTWYTYLEQGRGRDVSPSVLDSVAAALRLNEDERRHMHFLMYGQVITPRPLDQDVPVRELLKQITTLGDCNPYPVYMVDQPCDLLAWNDAAVEWYDDWEVLAGDQRNLLVWMFTAPKARRCFADWEETARDTLARWRADIARRAPNRKTQERIAHLKRVSLEFRNWWDSHDVMEHRTGTRTFLHPRMGRQALHVLPVTSFYDGTPVIVFHLPARGVTEDSHSGTLR
jgi:transcriptional regulator with XRE-family HTH domain